MNIEAKMTPRLRMVSSLVPKCGCVADIGTDHGYLPIYLVKKGICERAVAADVKHGPLSAARLNAAESGEGDKIKLVLSNGLERIDPEDAECVVIAGMGGELIAAILEGRKLGMERFVLQPQRSFEVLRRYLAENGFDIQKEAIAREDRRMYCALYAEYTGRKYDITEKEAFCGRAVVKNDPLFDEYMIYRRNIVINALKELEKGGGSEARKRELEKMADMYAEVRK